MEIPATRPGKFPTPTVAWERPDDPAQPLVILLHGRGSRESEIIGLAGHLPDGASYAALRAPIQEGPGFAWFANRGIGRPLPDSLAMTMAWFKDWLEEAAPAGRPVLLVGFSGGAAFAGGLILDQPERFKGGGHSLRHLAFRRRRTHRSRQAPGRPDVRGTGRIRHSHPCRTDGCHMEVPCGRIRCQDNGHQDRGGPPVGRPGRCGTGRMA